MNWLESFGASVLNAIVFGAIGIAVFLVALKLCVKISPFSIRKELEEDHNVAVGVVLGSVFIALGLIVAAAVHG